MNLNCLVYIVDTKSLSNNLNVCLASHIKQNGQWFATNTVFAHYLRPRQAIPVTTESHVALCLTSRFVPFSLSFLDNRLWIGSANLIGDELLKVAASAEEGQIR